METRTNKMMTVFYKVRDDVFSIIHDQPFRTVSYHKHTRQGRRRINEDYSIDYKNAKIDFYSQNFSAKEKRNHAVFSLKEKQILDPLSIFYYIRKLDLERNKKTKPVVVFDRGKTYSLTFEVKEIGPIFTKRFGRREMLELVPAATFEGVFVSSGKMRMSLDRETKIPMRIHIEIPVGWAIAELVSSNHPTLKTSHYRSRRGKR